MSAATAARPAVSVDELKRAWTAVQAGDFRNRTHRGMDRGTSRGTSSPARPTSPVDAEWIPAAGERTIAVLGAAGTVGTSTVALSLGLAAPDRVRVIECCSADASSMAAASSAELGLHPSGWRQGRRDHVLLERTSEHLAHVEEVPTPIPTQTTAETAAQLTVLDVSWNPGQVLATGCWLNDATRTADALVVVAPATVPGLRRLEATLELLGDERAVAALVGPRRKKWPKGVEHSAGPLTRRALDTARCVEIPEDRGLAVTGLDSRAIPEPVLAAARRLLDGLHLSHD